jgi:hypothetical protein
MICATVTTAGLLRDQIDMRILQVGGGGLDHRPSGADVQAVVFGQNDPFQLYEVFGGGWSKVPGRQFGS